MLEYIKYYKNLLHKYQSQKKIGIKPDITDIISINNKLNHILFHIYGLDKQKYEIVIARYNEPIDVWKPFFPITTIYNKGPNNLNIASIPLDNVGRESHTYLYHIIDNWDNLADTTLFTQCNLSFDHKPFPVSLYLLSHLDLTIHLWNNTIDFKNNIPWGFLQHGGKWLKEYNNGDMRKTTLTFGDWWDKYIEIDRPPLNTFLWSHGAIFSVKKELIKKKPLSYYQKLLTTINDCKNPEEGHYMERSWNKLFGKKF